MTCPDFNHLLVLPHFHVQNANAISSPLTHGFPSITAFLGLMWALERKTRAAGLDVSFKAVGVVCHDHQELVTEDGFVKSFRLTRNPVGKDGSTQAIVEEGRIHLELSLVFAVQSEHWLRDPEARDSDVKYIADLIQAMRIAGGTLRLPAKPWQRRYVPYVIDQSGDEDGRHAEFRKYKLRMLPGFTLVARDDVLDVRHTQLQLQNPHATRLDAWLSLSRINWHYDSAANDGKGRWANDRKGQGWIVPMPVGYGALGEMHAAGTVANARDAGTSFRFVESLYSIGQWLSPHRLDEPQQLLWYANSLPETGLYRCRNDYCPAHATSVFDSEID